MATDLPTSPFPDFPYPEDVAHNVALATLQANFRLAAALTLPTADIVLHLAEEIWAAFYCVRIPSKKVHFAQPRQCTLVLTAAATPTASFAAWASRIARTALIDLGRQHARRSSQNTALLADHEFKTRTETRLQAKFTNSMPESLPKLPSRLNRAIGGRAGRLGHNPNAYARALAYRLTHHLGWESLWLRLRLDSSLAREMGFERVPAVSRLRAAAHRIPQFCRKNPDLVAW